ncbi:DUF1453 domain-containing protein [Amycolatopsis albispora]|uniref:DUF1453 domain-containing protein n=1 Tax=Amycolatopsis albispora TaxID=1804986 RepID=UPI0019657147|nr:DUF1453 domain-containing protein [Amycolatopsis albispora]
MVAGIGYTIARRAIGEPLAARDLFATPVILLALGVHRVSEHGHLAAADWFWLICTGVVGLAFGVWRGTTVRLAVRDGVLWQRYPARAYLVWVVSLAGNAALGFLALSAGMAGDLRSMPLSIGVGLLGEALAIGARGMAAGVPFAPSGAGHPGLRFGARPAELPDAPTLRQAVLTLSGVRH